MEGIAGVAEALPPLVFDAAGVAGVAFYLLSYALLQAGVLRGHGYTYPSMNLAASALVLVSLATNFNLYSAIIQISWITISIGGMTRRYVRTRRIRFDGDEEALRDTLFRGLDPFIARRMFDAGEWVDGVPGRDFLQEGVVTQALWVVWDGDVRIFVENQEITRIPPPTFLGELTVLNGEPGIGTARVGPGGARLWRLPVEALRAVISSSEATRLQVEGLLSRESRKKLANANLRLSKAYKDEPAPLPGRYPTVPTQSVG